MRKNVKIFQLKIFIFKAQEFLFIAWASFRNGTPGTLVPHARISKLRTRRAIVMLVCFSEATALEIICHLFPYLLKIFII